MENGFSNLSLTTSNQAIQGDKNYKVKQLDFDTSCPCQITACDGGTIKVCAKMEIEDLVINSLCIDGELGCDKLVVQKGAAEGIAFSDDPCATPALPQRTVLFEDATSVNLIANVGNMNITGGATGAGYVEIRAPNGTNTLYSSDSTWISAPLTYVNVNGVRFDGPTHDVTTSRNITAQGGVGLLDARIKADRINTSMGMVGTGTAPAHDYGAAHDMGGDIAFSTDTLGSYLYFCFQDYDITNPTQRIWDRTNRFRNTW